MTADHELVENALPAYLLGASDPEEAEMVREHLAGCTSCQAVARRMQRTLDELPLGVEPASPPADLRARILTAAAGSMPVVRSAGATRPARKRGAPILKFPTRILDRALPVAAAAVIAFALGAGIGLGLGHSGAPQPAAVAQYTLTGSGGMSGAQGKVYELRSEGLTFVDFKGLPQPQAGRIYELWLIPQSGGAVPAGVFAPDAQGSHIQVVARSLAGFKELAVTEEVAPTGTTAPTQQPQLFGAIG